MGVSHTRSTTPPPCSVVSCSVVLYSAANECAKSYYWAMPETNHSHRAKLTSANPLITTFIVCVGSTLHTAALISNLPCLWSNTACRHNYGYHPTVYSIYMYVFATCTYLNAGNVVCKPEQPRDNWHAATCIYNMCMHGILSVCSGHCVRCVLLCSLLAWGVISAHA